MNDPPDQYHSYISANNKINPVYNSPPRLFYTPKLYSKGNRVIQTGLIQATNESSQLTVGYQSDTLQSPHISPFQYSTPFHHGLHTSSIRPMSTTTHDADNSYTALSPYTDPNIHLASRQPSLQTPEGQEGRVGLKSDPIDSAHAASHLSPLLQKSKAKLASETKAVVLQADMAIPNHPSLAFSLLPRHSSSSLLYGIHLPTGHVPHLSPNMSGTNTDMAPSPDPLPRPATAHAQLRPSTLAHTMLFHRPANCEHLPLPETPVSEPLLSREDTSGETGTWRHQHNRNAHTLYLQGHDSADNDLYPPRNKRITHLPLFCSRHEAARYAKVVVSTVAHQIIELEAKYRVLVPHLAASESAIASLITTYGTQFISHIDHNTKQKYIDFLQQQPCSQQNRLLKLLTGAQRLQNGILFTSKTAEVTTKTLIQLQDHRWLDNDSINGYMSLLIERSKRYKQSSNGPGPHLTMSPSYTLPSLWIFSSQFFSGMLRATPPGAPLAYDYQLVRRWSRANQVIINDLDLLLIPCHMHGNHWTLLAVDFPTRTIKYYDSLGGSDSGRANAVLCYLYDEWRTYGGSNGHPSAVSHPYKATGGAAPTPPTSSIQDIDASVFRPFDIVNMTRIPRQRGGDDCGVFVCMFANCLSLGLPTYGKTSAEYEAELQDLQQIGAQSYLPSSGNHTQHHRSLLDLPPYLPMFAKAKYAVIRRHSRITPNGALVPFSADDIPTCRKSIALALANEYVP